MPANVESMFSLNLVPWHGLGTIVSEAPNSAEALRLAGQDYQVGAEPVYLANGKRIPRKVANVRDRDGEVLGVTGKNYKIVQNAEAFAFTDALVPEGAVYETAGVLNHGQRIWIMMKFLRPVTGSTRSFSAKPL